MSILDFAENPNYEIIAVALSKDDIAVIFGVKPEKLRPALQMVIAALKDQLKRLPIENPDPLIHDKTGRKEIVREPNAANAS